MLIIRFLLTIQVFFAVRGQTGKGVNRTLFFGAENGIAQ
jgi:hypothetical protein